MKFRHALLVFCALDVLALGIACGARSDLPGYGAADGAGGEGAGGSGGADAAVDAPIDAPPDAPPECIPETTKFIYLVTSEQDLYSYNPETGAFALRGFLDCPSDSTPFSMGVDRTGSAYVVYSDGELFRVDMKDASCEATDFTPNQFGFLRFGMGYALDQVGGREDTLFVAEINFQGPPSGLATIDEDTLDLELIGPFSTTFGNALELTSSSDGNLYGYFLDPAGGGWVVEIDKQNATIVDATFLPIGQGSSALAFAWWGGDFWVFTSPGGVTDVERYDPDSGTVTYITSLNATVVGAGVSTCAPGG